MNFSLLADLEQMKFKLKKIKKGTARTPYKSTNEQEEQTPVFSKPGIKVRFLMEDENN
jgi:hypothetical protein